MHTRKVCAAVISVVLAVGLLFTGCGTTELINAILDVLSGRYDNITFTIDPELENTLRQCAAENDTLEEMLEDLEEKLGVTIDFEELRNGRRGDTAVSLIFQNGRDPVAIAKQVVEIWDAVLGALRASGEYEAKMAAVWAHGGYYIALYVTVEDSGSGGTFVPSAPSGPSWELPWWFPDFPWGNPEIKPK